MSNKVTIEGEKLMKHYESLNDNDMSTIALEPKMDCSGYWTKGWGHLIVDTLTKKPLRYAKDMARAYEIGTVTRETADIQFTQDVAIFAYALAKEVKVALTDSQFSALVSFCFNGGLGFFVSPSSVGRKINSNNFEAALATMLLYDKSDGVRLAGLYARRLSEVDLFRKGELWFYNVDKNFKVLGKVRG